MARSDTSRDGVGWLPSRLALAGCRLALTIVLASVYPAAAQQADEAVGTTADSAIVKNYLERYGVTFPEGAAISVERLNRFSARLTVKNTPLNLDRIEQVTGPYAGHFRQASVSFLLLDVSDRDAAACGLSDVTPGRRGDAKLAVVREAVGRWQTRVGVINALPALRAAEIRGVFDKKDARTVVDGVRGLPDTRVLDAATIQALSGRTAASRRVTQLSPADAHSSEAGLRIECTPTVLDDGVTVDLECCVSWSTLVGANDAAGQEPVLARTTFEGTCLMHPDTTAVIRCARPTLDQTGNPDESGESQQAEEWEGRALFLFITPRRVDSAVPAP